MPIKYSTLCLKILNKLNVTSSLKIIIDTQPDFILLTYNVIIKMLLILETNYIEKLNSNDVIYQIYYKLIENHVNTTRSLLNGFLNLKLEEFRNIVKLVIDTKPTNSF